MFGQTISRVWTFETSALTEAYHRLMFVAESGQDFALLAGDSGSGRTTLLKTVEKDLKRSGCGTISVGLSALNQTGLLWHLCGALSIAPGTDAAESAMLTAIRDEMLGRTHIGQRSVILLDDLDRAAEDVAPLLSFLRGLNRETRGMVVTLATADVRYSCPTADAGFRVLAPRLTSDESYAFVTAKLEANEVPSERVSEDGRQTLADLADGNLALLVRYCELTTVATTAEGSPPCFDGAEVRDLLGQVLCA